MTSLEDTSWTADGEPEHPPDQATAVVEDDDKYYSDHVDELLHDTVKSQGSN